MSGGKNDNKSSMGPPYVIYSHIGMRSLYFIQNKNVIFPIL